MFRVDVPRPRSLRGRLGAVATALTTPLLPEDYLSLIDPLWSSSELRGRVEAVQLETADVATLRLRPGRIWSGHRAGQFVRVGVDIDGVRHWRTYSLTCAESTPDGCLTITVKAQGLVSRHLVHATPVGAVLHLGVADGDFVLPDPVPPRLLFVTAGSGITPVLGMLRTLAERGPLPDVVLLHSARSADDVLFGAELTAMRGLQLTVRHTSTEGRLDLAELDTLCPDWRDRTAFVCGPTGLLDAATAHWTDPELLHLERFAPAPRVTGGEGGAVAFTRSGINTTADGATTLLEAGEAAGALMPSGCRMGICFSCVLPLRSGQVRDLRTGAVHGEADDLVQTCISAPAGDVQLDL